MRARFGILILSWFLLVVNGATAEPVVPVPGDCRPILWARPMDKTGLPNLYQVSETLYRGAQPTEEGLKELQRMGVKTVINLRSFHSDRDIVPEGLRYVSIPMKAWHIENEDLSQFLRLVQDSGQVPVFVHCQHGADRTGVVCAVYRMAIQEWTEEEAIKEMTEGGYGFWPRWGNIKQYLRNLDLEELR